MVVTWWIVAFLCSDFHSVDFHSDDEIVCVHCNKYGQLGDKRV